MKLKYIKLIIISIVSLFVAGCWDRNEINDIAFIMASSIDSAPDGKYKVTSQFSIPTGVESRQQELGSTLGKTYFLESAVGKNIFEAELLMQQKLSRKFFKGHRRVLLIGEEQAKKGIKDILDSFTRDPTSRLRTFLLVTKGTDGEELLKVKSFLERIPSEDIRGIERSDLGTAITLKDFMVMNIDKELSPIMGVIQLLESEKSGQERYQVSSTAIFQDYKLIGYLDDKNTFTLRWIQGKLQRGILSETIEEYNGNVGVVMKNSRSNINTHISGRDVNIHINLVGEGHINENNSDLDLNKPENIKKIEIALEEIIANNSNKTIEKAQTELKTDVFGLGKEISKEHPQKWKKIKSDWQEVFPETDISVSVDFHILRTGMTGPSISYD